MAKESTYIKSEYYDKYDVKRGLRDINGKGVLTGLTEISDIISSKTNAEGKSVPCKGELYYRGIKIDCKHCLKTFGMLISSGLLS